MKIQGRKSQQLGALGPINIPAQPEATPAAEQVSVGGDEVSLSSTQQLRKLRATVDALPAVRAEKVEDLKDAIEDGSYYVESHKLAKKVVDEVLSEALMNQLEGKKKG